MLSALSLSFQEVKQGVDRWPHAFSNSAAWLLQVPSKARSKKQWITGHLIG